MQGCERLLLVNQWDANTPENAPLRCDVIVVMLFARAHQSTRLSGIQTSSGCPQTTASLQVSTHTWCIYHVYLHSCCLSSTHTDVCIVDETLLIVAALRGAVWSLCCVRSVMCAAFLTCAADALEKTLDRMTPADCPDW